MSGMKDLFGDTPYELPQPAAGRAFDGETYAPERDYVRLNGQLARVHDFMSDGVWRTLAEISSGAGGTEASVSARLRDFRKAKYWSRTVERRHIAGGLYQYRLKPHEE